jgi:hypothetical protein
MTFYLKHAREAIRKSENEADETSNGSALMGGVMGEGFGEAWVCCALYLYLQASG